MQPAPQSGPPTVADRVRQAIAPAHVAVEQTAFARGMVAGTLDRAGYCLGLRQLMHLHAALEGALEGAADDPTVRAVYAADRMARTHVAARDLAALGHPADAADDAAPVVSRLGEAFAAMSPAGLVGALYVLEGSKMGSLILARSLGKCLGVARGEPGLDYHAEGAATRVPDWQRFRGAVAGADWTPAAADEVVAGAVAVMDGLVELYAAVPARADAVAVG